MGRGDSILVLKTGETLPLVKESFGDFEDWIAKGLGHPVEGVKVASVYAGDPLPSTDSIGGVVVTGSPAMVSQREDWSEASARWLARIVERDSVPVLGLCFGHQLLAHALGGEVGLNPKGREMGTVEVTIPDEGVAEDPLLSAGIFPGHMSHLESVLVPPSDARILASTVLEGHAAIQYGPRQWGVQFHPEFNLEIMRLYVEARREVLIQEGHDPDGIIAKAVETSTLNDVLERFQRIARGD